MAPKIMTASQLRDLRDWFAGQALAGNPGWTAEQCYALADEMMRVRDLDAADLAGGDQATREDGGLE